MSMFQANYQFVKRSEASHLWQVLALLLTTAASLVVSGILLYSSGHDPFKAFYAMYDGALGEFESILETLVRATPLALTGLATVIAFRAKIWSIGQEGQLIMGAITAYGATLLFKGLPAFFMLPLVIMASFAGGACLGLLCGWLKSRFKVDEIISTVMFNYIVVYLLTYLLSGPWMQAGDYYQQTEPVIETALLPYLVEDTRLHAGLIIALLATAAVYVLMKRTPLGYDIKALGSNPIAARFKGTDVKKVLLVTMFLSGGMAGMAGAGELLGVHGRLNNDISTGLGYTGIIVAMVGGLNPIGTLLAAFLFGGLVNGGFMMQVLTGTPLSMVYAMQAIFLLFYLCGALLVHYRLVRVRVSCDV